MIYIGLVQVLLTLRVEHSRSALGIEKVSALVNVGGNSTSTLYIALFLFNNSILTNNFISFHSNQRVWDSFLNHVSFYTKIAAGGRLEGF